MKHETIIRLRRLSIRSAAILGSLCLALTLTSPVLAGHRGHGYKGGHSHHSHATVHYGDHGHPRYPAPPPVRHFVVPRVIRSSYVETYRPYYSGYVQYAPHGHAHAVYSFPVWHDDALYYEPRYYCGGELFVGGHVAYSGPRVSFHIAF